MAYFGDDAVKEIKGIEEEIKQHTIKYTEEGRTDRERNSKTRNPILQIKIEKVRKHKQNSCKQSDITKFRFSAWRKSQQ